MKYQIINGAITFENNTILEEINFTINKNDKIAIVGRNGSGKTSLLKSLVDNDMLESGLGLDDLKIVKIGKPSIGYQEQHAFSNLNVTLLDEILKVYKDITNLENKIKKLEDKMVSNATSETILEYTDCIERYKLIGGYSYKKECMRQRLWHENRMSLSRTLQNIRIFPKQPFPGTLITRIPLPKRTRRSSPMPWKN